MPSVILLAITTQGLCQAPPPGLKKVVVSPSPSSLSQLDLDASTVARALLDAPRLKIKERHIALQGAHRLRIYPQEAGREAALFALQVVTRGGGGSE